MRLPLLKSLNKQRKSARGGFSLVEVMIGMVILLIALGAAATVSVSNAQLVARNQYAVHAANLAEWKMEDLRNTAFANVVTGQDNASINSTATGPGDFVRSWTVFNDTPEVGLKRVVVTVSWSQFNDTQSYSLVGVIGR